MSALPQRPGLVAVRAPDDTSLFHARNGAMYRAEIIGGERVIYMPEGDFRQLCATGGAPWAAANPDLVRDLAPLRAGA
jgi:hypothetical protein